MKKTLINSLKVQNYWKYMTFINVLLICNKWQIHTFFGNRTWMNFNQITTNSTKCPIIMILHNSWEKYCQYVDIYLDRFFRIKRLLTIKLKCHTIPYIHSSLFSLTFICWCLCKRTRSQWKHHAQSPQEQTKKNRSRDFKNE